MNDIRPPPATIVAHLQMTIGKPAVIVLTIAIQSLRDPDGSG